MFASISTHLLKFGKYKVIFLTILCLYAFLFTLSPILGHKFTSQFTDIDESIKLPTTSHLDSINLKKVRVLSQDDIRNLRDQLSYTFPYDPSQPIPRRVWQTWKNTPSDADFPENFREFQAHWSSDYFVDGYQYSLVPDDNIVPLLKNLYGEIPLIIEAYEALPTVILKADFFRYLILYARGGIYSDMDTYPLKPLSLWPSVNRAFFPSLATASNAEELTNELIPYKNLHRAAIELHPEREPGFVAGIEADPDRPDWNEWYARRIQFCQWTIQAKPGHPILRELIMNITTTTLRSVKLGNVHDFDIGEMIDQRNARDYNINYRGKKANDPNVKHSALKTKHDVDGTDIMNWTGPGIFTDIIFEYLTNLIQHNNDVLILNPNLNSKQIEKKGDNKEEVEEEHRRGEFDKSTRKFYKEIAKSLQSDAVFPWEFFSLITEPVVIDDVMILPITCFSPGVMQMEAKGPEDEMAFVMHRFEGSWKEEADANAGH